MIILGIAFNRDIYQYLCKLPGNGRDSIYWAYGEKSNISVHSLRKLIASREVGVDIE